jgi:hypothetical protein
VLESLTVEVIADVGVDRGELLKSFRLSELQHRALSSSEGQVAILHPVVGVAPTSCLWRLSSSSIAAP